MKPKTESFILSVEQVIFPRIEDDIKKREDGESNLFYIFKYTTAFGLSGTAKGGLLHRPQPGETFTVTGWFEANRGERVFMFKSANPYIPDSSRELLAYACDLTNGFGERTEEAIWEAYGEGWKEIPDEAVGEIRNLTEEKLARFRKTIEELELRREEAKAIAWLKSHFVSNRNAEKTIAEFGAKTIATVSENPYALTKVDGIGFLTVDGDIRRSFGIGDQDPRRIRECIRYCMGELTSRGDTVIPVFLLETEYRKICHDIPKLLGDQEFMRLITSGELVLFKTSSLVSRREEFDAEMAIFQFATGVGHEFRQ